MFEAENRQATMQQIEEILPFIQDDTELVKVVTGTIEKMKRTVLRRLHEKQAAIAVRSGKPAPQMGLEQEAERNRK